MAKITAQGKVYGLEVIVEVKGKDDDYRIEITPENRIVRELLEEKLDEKWPIGGTFTPERNSMLNIANTLEVNFFDEIRPKVTIKGDIGTIPYQDGVIY